ncbi:MAG TPA: YcnI family protein [Candidatus Saccharimonadales bacterium]|nr:YcnI family protein [Candidatus Saccharimonadales bacterium]
MKINKQVAALTLSVSALVLSFGGLATAHVTVKPGEAPTGSYQTFSIGVPTEKDQPTVAVRLDVPKGVASVMPTVIPGWTITTERSGSGEDAVVTSISWTGGQIGAGLRGEFTFSAKTPDNPTTLQWKAYQTYADGSVVAWNASEADQPKKADGSPDFATTGPFSVTEVAAEDPATATANSQSVDDAQRTANRSQTLALLALAVALAAFALITRANKKK